MLEDVTVDCGATLHLTCPVYGGDNLVITEWYKDGKMIEIKSGTHFSIATQHSDDGMYHCVALQGGQRIASNVARVNIKGISGFMRHYCNHVMLIYCSCCQLFKSRGKAHCRRH